MIFLLFAIIFGSLFSVIFKICQRRQIDTSQVILFNYVTAIVFSIVPMLMAVARGEAEFADYALAPKPLLLAVLQGVFFYLGFLVMNRSTWRSGVALTTAAARASLILPLILSWLFFSQTAPSWLLVALMLVAMGLMVIPAESEKHDASQLTGISEKARRVKTMLALLAVFLCYGISDFMLKVVQNSVDTEAGLSSQMTVIFISASAASLVACIANGSFRNDGRAHRDSLHQGFRWRNFVGGLILGLVNTGCTACMLRALASISTSIFYPVYNICIVVLATLTGVLFFKEKIKPVQIGGLLLALTAISLQLM
ncbi:MAG: EamA family transporter [Bacteroidales bacterium]|nr:EamA family transporter [Bacteroidales bacterium]